MCYLLATELRTSIVIPSPRFLRNLISSFINPRQLGSAFLFPKFIAEFRKYRRVSHGEKIFLRDVFPCLADRMAHTPFDPHYFYQGAWLARRLRETAPVVHVDIGSSVVMSSVLSGAVPLVCVDYRPLHARLTGLQSVAGNAVQLPFFNNVVKSLSSLHVIEHIGLGRYGDPIDPEGSQKAIREFQRVLNPGGHLYLSVPVGRERVCFNAHRVFAPQSIVRLVPSLRLRSFALVDDRGWFEENVSLEKATDLEYGCGMFEFVKPDA